MAAPTIHECMVAQIDHTVVVALGTTNPIATLIAIAGRKELEIHPTPWPHGHCQEKPQTLP